MANEARLSQTTWVPLGVLFALVSVAAVGAWKAAWAVASMQRDEVANRELAAMERAALRRSLDELKLLIEAKTSDRVSSHELDSLLERLGELNPDIRVPRRRP